MREHFHGLWTEKTYPTLIGHSIYVVDDPRLLDNYAASLSIDMKMILSGINSSVPENLLEIMENENIESALLHVNTLSGIEPTLKVHASGRKVIVQNTY